MWTFFMRISYVALLQLGLLINVKMAGCTFSSTLCLVQDFIIAEVCTRDCTPKPLNSFAILCSTVLSMKTLLLRHTAQNYAVIVNKNKTINIPKNVMRLNNEQLNIWAILIQIQILYHEEFFFSIPTFKSAFKPHESSMQPLHIKSATLDDYKIS